MSGDGSIWGKVLHNGSIEAAVAQILGEVLILALVLPGDPRKVKTAVFYFDGISMVLLCIALPSIKPVSIECLMLVINFQYAVYIVFNVIIQKI